MASLAASIPTAELQALRKRLDRLTRVIADVREKRLVHLTSAQILAEWEQRVQFDIDRINRELAERGGTDAPRS